ncbi:Ligand-dependent corepressor [Labeo rohita]|uniref:Ligand-dependent corepressor n=1 Tax=Labeo rohita TaxID=84645 RepID=A0ABQ8M3C0_LABRO|nr:Ligand-dependent corepressor [Labeo rohita]
MASKEHVVALNKQIVESGGKPLLGKDPSHISRLERQAEEFLDAVLHRKEYTPKIPDPHIPVVACGIVQQMINELASYYTSRKNSSQDALQNNGKKDQSLVKPSCVTSSPAVKIDSVASAQKKFIMVDQDAPLDLSLRKVKVEDFEQDGVLDLSTKKNLNKGHTSSRNSHVSPATNSVKRDSIDLSLAEVKDLQSVTTLEEFTAKLCFHHQRQIVDALGFLQSEVNTLAPSNHFQALTADLSEKQATTSCSYASFETRSEIQWSARTCSVDAAVSISKTQDSSVVRTSQKPTAEALKADVSSMAHVMTEKLVELDKMEVLSSSSCETGAECGSSPPKSLVVTETTADNLVLGSSVQQISSSNSVKKCLCSPEQCLPTCTAESDHADLSKRTQKCSFASEDVVVNTSTVQKTINIVSPISPRTARKSRRGSCLRQSNGSLSCLINDPDSHCDLVFIRKSITECQPQSRSRLHPRQNARKSTRGHKYVEEYLEVKTVRTLARKSIGVSSGNYPAHMTDLHTLVIPKQVLSASGSVPLVNTPFAGDCMKNVIPKLSSEQIAENEMPGDVVKVTSLDLMVETSQTGKSESNSHILSEPSGKQSELTVQPDLLSEALSCTLNAVVQEKHMNMVEENTETTELVVQKEGCGSQMGPMPEEVVCGPENKAEEDKSMEPSPIPPSPNMAKECSTDEVNVEQRNERHLKKPTEVETAADVQEQSEASEIKANSEEDGGAQGQGVLDTEGNLQTANSSELPVRNQGDSVLTEVSSVQPLVKCQGKDTDVHSSKVLNAKHPVSSDRCLRSRSSKASVDVTKESVKCGASDPVDHANDKSPKAHSTETNVHTEQEPDLKAVDILETAQELPAAKPCNGLVVDHAVQTRPKSRTATTVGRDNHASPGVQVNNNDLPSVLSPEVLPETVSTTSTTESGKHNKLKSEASESTERMPLRNKSSTAELSVSGPCSPSKESSPSSENMLLRSRSNTEGPSSSKSISPTEGHSEKQGQTPLRSEQATNRDLSTSSEAVTHMPLRSRTVSSVKPTVTKDSPVKSSVKSEQPVSSHSGATCRKPEANGHMPLRSSASLIAEQPRNNKSAVVDASESPGRMSLRRGNVSNTEKLCGTTTTTTPTPSRNKRPLKQQRVSTSSSGEAEESLLSSKLKIHNQKAQVEAQLRGSLNLPDESFRIASLKATEPVVCSPPKFLEALRGEEHQQLISNLNSKFDKMHKSWVPLDKEGQPAPKPKNKADRLKEIWKSKRRARKSRPLEQQKLTAVQMLFMKPFDLPSICRWFLQSTETKSLVIVKKVNTRLPSETQLCFHTSAAGAGSSHGIFPSLQAERLKKHLKKFAIASPVKNNPKNQRLLSKALGQGISAMRSKEKHEPTTATRICTKAQSLAGAAQAQAPESLAVTAGSAKNPASARILRKYSNMREKLQVQQNKKCKEKTFKGARLKAAILPKKANKQKLTTRKASKSVVQRISSLTKTAKTNSALKQRALKRNPCHKDGASPKRLQALKRMTKAIGALDKSRRPNTLSKKRTLIKTGTSKAQQMKASLTKVDTKKPVFQKGPSNLESQSSDVDVKPLTLEDQVLTRSQRKMEGTPSQTGSPKSSTKRGLEPLVTPSKRTRTSKP